MFRTYKKKYATHKFCLLKEQEFPEAESARKQLVKYNLLQNAIFGPIHIPAFIATIDECTITLEMEFIKGIQWTGLDLINNYDLVADHIVLNENEYSLSDFSPQNFITEFETEKIFYVDLESYKSISQLDRFKLLEEECNKIRRLIS